ncbi:metal ABC transporter permease [bacterium]|nr:metal ABC transporter permease [bacterium]
MNVELSILLTAASVAIGCSLVGTLLVLRRMSLISDAISHSVLLGIVLAFLATRDLNSPWLLVGAAAVGVLTVVLIQLLLGTRRLREDSAIGLVFPLLFSIGVILITRMAGDVHLDTDAVLLGELGFAWMDTASLLGMELPRSFIVSFIVLLANLLFVTLCYKELKLSIFDAGLAASLGFSPLLLHYLLVSLVSVTAVASFDAVGSILMVALMIAPPSAAWLLSRSLAQMLGWSALLATVSAVGGYYLAVKIDSNIAGCIAAACGICFLVCWLLAPERGLVSRWLQQAQQRLLFPAQMLAVHIANHEGRPEEPVECNTENIAEHMHWQEQFAREVIGYAQRHRMLREQDSILRLTEEGRGIAEKLMLHG